MQGDLNSNYGCGQITEAVENVVETYSENCNPLQAVYGKSGSKIIKKTISTSTEKSQCSGLTFFNSSTPGDDRNVIESCTAGWYWCCCETIKKVSPIIAGATVNLLIHEE